MTFSAAFAQPFARPFPSQGAVAEIPWYLSGGISAANCAVAYAAKGAASLAASYDNLAAPGNGLPDGTYDATAGTPPTWNATDGWIFANLVNSYLTIGTFGFDYNGLTLLVRFTTTNVSVRGTFFGQNNTANCPSVETGSGGISVITPGVFQAVSATPIITNGVNVAIGYVKRGNGATHEIYKDGVLQSLTTNAAVTYASTSCVKEIGRRALASQHWYGTIQAYAIYSSAITTAQVLAVSNAMNAL